MYGSRERMCDAILDDPLLKTPPPVPPPPPPPKEIKRKEYKIPARPVEVDKEFYGRWYQHRVHLAQAKPIIDAKPPSLFPENFLKFRKLTKYACLVDDLMVENRNIVKKLNMINREGGWVGSKRKEPYTDEPEVLLMKKRERVLDMINTENHIIHKKLLVAHSDMPDTEQLNKLWDKTKQNLIMGSTLPFILFKRETIDRGITDEDMAKAAGTFRPRVNLELKVLGGSKLGRVSIELFTDIVPKTCMLFMSLVRGDKYGHAYKGTKVFRIVPRLYCRIGDVTKDNGFGCYVQEGQTEPMRAENFELKHSVPGTLSMVVTTDDEVCGSFNIIFKPIPELDGKHVVFGRIVSGPTEFLERISCLGRPLGTPNQTVLVEHCGLVTRKGIYREGRTNTIIRRFNTATRK